MKFVNNEAAIVHKDALIIGDIHFGIEDRLKQKGIHEKTFSERMEKKIEELLKKTKTKKLILAGDVKDNILQFDDITKDMLKKLSEHAEIIIVKGNHDGGLETCADFTVVPPDGLVYKSLGIFHGHTWPSEKILQCKEIVSAHQHPQVEFTDRLGKKHFEPAWVIAEADATEIKKHYENFNPTSRLILLPAFNPLVGSSLKQHAHLGPSLNNNLFKLNDALVFSISGMLIGKLGDIKKV